ncbi:MAG: MmgE/PrpD family protein, partial [Chloroflexota bacterium]|nr:MmgE/PrpD family protein [Chloroflexota bacterium]
MTQVPNGNVTGILADYMAAARDRALPADVDREAKHRLLDSLAAVISGSTLLPGRMAEKYVRTLGGVPESVVMTTDVVTSAANAALANGMMGHADETDDFDPSSKAHPGCSVVPAAWAMAEREGASGAELLPARARRGGPARPPRHPRPPPPQPPGPPPPPGVVAAL